MTYSLRGPVGPLEGMGCGVRRQTDTDQTLSVGVGPNVSGTLTVTGEIPSKTFTFLKGKCQGSLGNTF